MIDLLPPDFHGTDNEKLLQLIKYTQLLYDALSRKMENIDTQDLTPSLAQIIMMIQNYYYDTLHYTVNDTETINFNDNSLMLAFLEQSYMNIRKETYHFHLLDITYGAATTSGGQRIPDVTAVTQGDLLMYFGSINAPATITLSIPYISAPQIYISKGGLIEAPALGQSSSAPDNSATTTVNTITISGDGRVDFTAIGIRGGD